MSPNAPSANLTPSVAWLLLSPIGRVSREPYWLGFMLVTVIFLVSLNAGTPLPEDTEMTPAEVMSYIEANSLFPFLYFFLIWVELALVIKRCQDIGLSGFLAVLVLVPVVNFISVLILGLMPSSPDANRYGPLPNSYYRRS